ncbi:hypothetical protein B4123_2380 [Bacillus paralicheniformis]|nr:hypothetical protein B4123_2380 [Bacillus paralicheniformis]
MGESGYTKKQKTASSFLPFFHSCLIESVTRYKGVMKFY